MIQNSIEKLRKGVLTLSMLFINSVLIIHGQCLQQVQGSSPSMGLELRSMRFANIEVKSQPEVRGNCTEGGSVPSRELLSNSTRSSVVRLNCDRNPSSLDFVRDRCECACRSHVCLSFSVFGSVYSGHFKLPAFIRLKGA